MVTYTFCEPDRDVIKVGMHPPLANVYGNAPPGMLTVMETWTLESIGLYCAYVHELIVFSTVEPKGLVCI